MVILELLHSILNFVDIWNTDHILDIPKNKNICNHYLNWLSTLIITVYSGYKDSPKKLFL